MISFVVAIAENGVIGRENGLPWRLSSDLKRFKATTMGKPIIMGRKTWDSLGRPLPGRTNIVITRDPAFSVEGVIAARSIDQALMIAGSHAGADKVDEICIIGGGDIFRQIVEPRRQAICDLGPGRSRRRCGFPPDRSKGMDRGFQRGFPGG